VHVIVTLATVGDRLFEFAVLPTRLPSREHAERLAARIHATLAEPITLDDVEVRTSASIGIAVADPIRSVPSDVLLQEADLAMYQAKREGRSRTAVFDSG
jgi:diguanylate cyclase (GGDEF)-like protein